MRTILLILFIAISNHVLSQNISFDQVQNLRQKSLAEVETFLTEKGWSMTDAKGATTETMGKATFGYEVSRYDSEKAVGWINFYESSVGNSYNRLSMQLHKASLYSTYLTRLTSNGYKLKSSKIVDGGLEKVYSNAITTCIVTTSTSDGTYTKSTTYSFLFMDNLDYKLTFETKE